jgi:predicted glycosyltransferase
MLMSPQPTILFHPQNHVGLGHANRLGAIALALRQINAAVRTPFVLEGAHHLLFDALGLPYLPLPSSHLMFESDSWANWTKNERSTVTTEIGRAIISSLKPEVVVFDCIPNLAFASAVIEENLPVVLCLRETRDVERYVERLEYLLPYVKLVLVPHNPNEFSLPGPFRAKACFVGKVARQMKPAAGRTNDRRIGACRIVVSGGGGGYPGTVEFYNLALRALAELRSSGVEIEAQLIAGPLFMDWRRLELCGDVCVVPYDPDMASTFAAADLVICQAGYNTVAELEQTGTRVILSPAERKWDDQFTRARRTEQENLQFRVFQQSSPEDLAALAREMLRKADVDPRVPAQPEGARRAAEKLYSMLEKP